MRSHPFVKFLVPALAIALIATACSGSEKAERGASGSLGDPTQLAPLPAGPTVPTDDVRAPVFPGAVITPDVGRSTSVSPTLLAPGAQGDVKFVLRDLSTGAGGFSRSYNAAGNSVRVPVGAGLTDGRVYTWTATDAAGAVRGGTFIVDVTASGVQPTDAIGGVTTGLASGAATVSWSSHSMNSVAGQVGLGLVFDTANPSEAGVPSGWDLQVASSSQFSHLTVREDGSIGVHSLDGAVTTYRVATGGSYEPVALSGQYRVTGAAPVLTGNADGTFTVLDKQSSSVFSAPGEGGVADLVSVTGSDSAVLGQTWSGGRLRSIDDPVSKRSVTLEYGGGKCGSVASGFIAAPKDMVCRVNFWDGSAASIWYVSMPDGSVQIGRLIDNPDAKGAGADVTDLAYDSIGRVVTMRSPVIASVVAAGLIPADDLTCTTRVAYDDMGRVATITGPATSIGGSSDIRTYQRNSNRSTDVLDSAFGGVLSSVTFDPVSWRALSVTDASGLAETYEYEPASGNLIRQIDRNGNVTTRSYSEGRLIEVRGPTEGSLATDATISRYGYDQTFADAADGREITGLDVRYWADSDWTGGVERSETGPTIDGAPAPSLTVNWETSPVGTGSWSARMTGVFPVATQGNYAFASANATAKLWIDSVECAGVGCNALPLAAGLHDIRVDVSSATPAASMSITWSGPDTGGSATSMPLSLLRPQYGLITTTRSNDQIAPGAASVDTVARTVYAQPSTGQVAERRSQGGGVSSLTYEPSTGGGGKWGRQNSATMPSGTSIAISYWGDTESAKSACPDATSANQGGLTRSSAYPGTAGAAGPVSQAWYDAAGRVVASKLGDGATTCTYYGPSGRVTKVVRVGMGQSESTSTVYGVGGNPLIAETTITTGKDVATTRTELDLAGRTVASTDRFGVVTRITYDPRTGNPATTTVTAPGAAPIVSTTEYSADARISRVLVDGAAAATLTYNQDGTVGSVSYGNGTSATIGYDDSNRASSMRWKTSDARSITSTRDIAVGGRILSATSSLDAVSSRFDYTYDDARHLASASLTAGLTAAHDWVYTFDANGNRVSQKVDGTTFAYTYDDADHLLTTTDPSITGTVEYDSRGNATRVGSDVFTYDAADGLITATDGTTTIDFVRDATGIAISRTIRDTAGESTVQYASGGILLDGTGRAVTAEIPLPGGVTIERSLSDPASSVWAYNDLSANRLFTTTTSGALVGELRVYDPFGAPLTPAPAVQPADTRNLAWQAAFGQETQPLKTPFVVMGARVYMPALGRFLQLDPKIGGSANGYDFVSQDPVNLFDPTGRSLGDWIAMLVVSVVSIAAAPLTGGGSVLAGMAIGLAVGAAGYLIEFGIKSAIDGATEFSVTQLAISAGLGAAFGAFGAGVFGKKAAESVETSVTSPVRRMSASQTTAAISDSKATTFTVRHLDGESRAMWAFDRGVAQKEVQEAASGLAATVKDKYGMGVLAQMGHKNASERFARIANADPDMYWAFRDSLIYPG